MRLSLAKNDKELEMKAYEHLHQAAKDNNKSAIKLLKTILKSNLLPAATLFSATTEMKREIREFKGIDPDAVVIIDMETEIKTSLPEIQLESKKPMVMQPRHKDLDQFVHWTLNDEHLYRAFITKHQKVVALNFVKTTISQINAHINSLIDSPRKTDVMKNLRTIATQLEDTEHLHINLPIVEKEIAKLADQALSLFVRTDERNDVEKKFSELGEWIPVLIKILARLSTTPEESVNSNFTRGTTSRR